MTSTSNSDAQNAHLDNMEDNWVTPTQRNPRKRTGSPPGGPQTQKRNTPVNLDTQNRFQVLENQNSEEEPQVREYKPPPIFIPGVTNFQNLTDILDTVAKNDYQCKIIGKDQVKLQPLSVENFRKIVHRLKEENTAFHTYQIKQERHYRVVLRNIHYSVDIEDIKDEIEKYGHKVTNIHNIQHRVTRAPLSMFFVDLAPTSNNKDIYNIKSLLHTRVVFEPPHTKRQIAQCMNCQRYGHTRAYCFRQPRCVACGKNHAKQNCTKTEDAPPTCALCTGTHPANYKGCQVYKEMQNRKYPALRPKQVAQQPQAQNNSGTSTQSPSRTVTPNVSFSQIVQATKQQTENNNPNQNIAHSTQTHNKLENMMITLMQRMDTMLNLLTTVITNMSKWSHP